MEILPLPRCVLVGEIFDYVFHRFFNISGEHIPFVRREP
jgi:hypothetical protein